MIGPAESAAVFVAGIAAGVINSMVGSATLMTFPLLLSLGIPPVTANVSNGIGLVPGAAFGALGYRRELRGQGALIKRLGFVAGIGAVAGAVVLLVLPPGAFEAIVPVLVLAGVILVIIGPPVSRWVSARASAGGQQRPRWLDPAVAVTGVYGGYFGAAQGVLLLAILGVGVGEDLQRTNAVKNVLAALINGVSGVIFAFVADVDWWIVVLLAVGSAIGGRLGASFGRRLPAVAYRALIVAVGLIAFVATLVS